MAILEREEGIHNQNQTKKKKMRMRAIFESILSFSVSNLSPHKAGPNSDSATRNHRNRSSKSDPLTSLHPPADTRTDIVESGNYHFNPRFSNESMMCSISPMQYQYVGSPRHSVSYSKVQQPFLRLTVLKFDGSCFGIEMSNMGTVGELKRAVEAAFSHLPKEGPGRVSWEHVWGHICLCHEGEMLLNDTDYISMIGMEDGDELQFVHHASSTNNFVRIKSKGADSDDEPHKDKNKRSEKEESIDDEWDDMGGFWSQGEQRLSLLLTGWFPYQKLSSSRSCSSRSPSNVLASLINCFRFSV